jgi:tol-pal system protein YbgF
MNDYYISLGAGKTGLFLNKAMAVIAAFMLLPVSGCVSSSGKKKAAADSAFADSDLRGRLSKQQIIIDDLSGRITQLENLILKQEYELEKLKKIVKKQNVESIELAKEEIQTNEAAGDEEAGGSAMQEGSDYSIFVENGHAYGPGEAGGANPVLKLYGNAGKTGYSAAPEKSNDMSSLMQDAAAASSYVSLKLDPAALNVSGADPSGTSAGKQPPAAGETALAQAVDPYEAGIAKFKQGKWLDASLYFDIFIKKNPDSIKTPNALFLKGESLYQAGKFIEALGTFEMVEYKYSTFVRIPEAKFRIARCYERMNDKEGAIKAYENIVQNYPKSAVAAKALKHLKEMKKK